jgi:sugar phosphate isomerase/epimerase
VNSLNDIGLTSAQTHDRNACRSLFRRAVQAAVALDIDVVIVPSFRKSFIRDDDDLASTEAFLHAACTIAAESNVSVATENVLAPGRLSAALSRVAAPNLRVLADLGNLAEYDIDPVDFATAADDRLHPDIHVKDLKTGSAGDCQLGAGVLDLATNVAEFRRLFSTTGFVVETDHRRSSPDQVSADLEWLVTVLADAEKEHN